MQDELKEEKRLIHDEIDKERIAQEKKMLSIQESINKRLMEEDKKMQEFYLWKEKEIEKIRELKKAAEKEYLARKVENELDKKNQQTDEKKIISAKVAAPKTKEGEEINSELKQWLKEQVQNELTPINREVQNAKRKLIEQANVRAEKSKIQQKIHDQMLSSEIDTLLKGVEN